jgi:hypothetical protein
VTPCSLLESHQCFGLFYNPPMEAGRCFETPMPTYQTTRLHKNAIFSHRRVNPKSHAVLSTNEALRVEVATKDSIHGPAEYKPCARLPPYP